MKKVFSMLLISLMVLGTVFSPVGSITGYAKILDDSSALVRSTAADGIVLLKNEKVNGNAVLPLKSTDKVALFGVGQVVTLPGGGGSATIRSPYIVTGLEGMKNAAAEGRFTFVDGLSAAYETYGKATGSAANQDEMEITRAQVKSIAADADTAVIFITRHATESRDQEKNATSFVKSDYNKDGFGYARSYNLTDKEKNMIELVQNHFKKIVVVLNIPGAIDTSWFADNTKIAAAVSAWYPGMEAGNAIADVLCGKVNPSAKLTITMASSLDDYLSTQNFGTQEVTYKEDIFVGYRQFETFDPTYSKVNYPFGHGLSYTTFSITPSVTVEGGNVKIKATVKNTGSVSGREVVQTYFSAPQRNGASGAKLSKPGKELAAFGKTKTLAPGETQVLDLTFPVSDMASYDDTGATGHKSAYVLEAGDYNIYVGNSIKNAGENGVKYTYKQSAAEVVEQLTEALTPVVRFQKMEADGKYVFAKAGSDTSAAPANANEPYKKESYDIPFSAVKDDPSLMEAFVAQLSTDEIINFICTSIATGYQLDKWGVPNLSMTDGPAGIRLPDKDDNIQTWYPCGILLASTWDPELVERVGQQLGKEMADEQDLVWAPSLNIHRSPLCGRNFEYYSEDPYVSGKIAAAMVRGLQSERKGVTLKHFTANNQETYRQTNNVIVTERAMREIYLKGFEIAVKEADPWGIMSSYNLVNGVYTAERYDLLTKIVRGEWGYKGYFSTDWGGSGNYTPSKMVKAGTDLLLGNYDLNKPKLKADINNGTLKRQDIEVCAKNILEMMLKTTAADKIKGKSFTHKISSTGRTQIAAVDRVSSSDGVGTEAVKVKDSSGNPIKNPVTDLSEQINCMGCGRTVTYKISVSAAGTYDLAVRLSYSPGAEPTPLEFYLDDAAAPVTSIPHEDMQQSGYFEHTTAYTSINLPEGSHTLTVKAPSASRNVFNLIDYSFAPTLSVSESAAKTIDASNFLGQSAYITIDKAEIDTSMATDHNEVRGLKSGRWVEYPITVESDGVYSIDALMKGENANQTLKILDGTTEIGTIKSGDAGKYETKSVNVKLTAGKHLLRFTSDDDAAISLVEFALKYLISDDIKTISLSQNQSWYIGSDRAAAPLNVKAINKDGTETDLTGNEFITYESSDESVFKFDGNKLYSTGKKGKAVITANYFGITAKLLVTRQDAQTVPSGMVKNPQPIAPEANVDNATNSAYITTGTPGTAEGGHYDGQALSNFIDNWHVRLVRKSWTSGNKKDNVSESDVTLRWFESGYRSMGGWFYDDGNTSHQQGFSYVQMADSILFHKDFAKDYGYDEFASKWEGMQSWVAYNSKSMRGVNSAYIDGKAFGGSDTNIKERTKGWHQFVSSLEKNPEAEYGWTVYSYLDGELIGSIDIVPEETDTAAATGSDSNSWAALEIKPVYDAGYKTYMDDMILMGGLGTIDNARSITADVGEHGSITVNGAALANGASARFGAGENVTIKVKADYGYEADEVKLGDSVLTLNSNHEVTVVMPDSNVTVTVTFKERDLAKPDVTTDAESNYLKTVNGVDTIYAYAKISDYYDPSASASGYGIKLWVKGDAKNFITLPAMLNAGTPAISEPDKAFAIKVYGNAINKDTTYVFKPYVGTTEGEDTEVSYKD